MNSEIEIMATSPDTGNSSKDIDLDKMRKRIKSYIDNHLYLAAEFWAGKLVTLSKGAYIDVYYLAQCYYLTRQYHRAILLIANHNLNRNPSCRYLSAKCYFHVNEYQSAIDVLDGTKGATHGFNADSASIAIPEIEDSSSIESSIHLLKGYIHEAAENRTLAQESFRAAIEADPFCYEAFHALTQHHMLSLEEEKELLSSLPISKNWNEVEESLIRFVYETQLNKYSGVTPKLTQQNIGLENNLDLITAEAENLYYNCDFTNCFKLTQRVLQKDPYHSNCLPIHISCLVELKQSNTLFLLGHKLVDLYPESSLSWFAVGCYYYLIGKNDHARRFLNKATSLDRVFGPAWIAYGHSFAAENEHDQARAAYYKAAQLMKGCHLPLLYIGMEYSLTNNPKFAEKFFKQALEIAPSDPFVHHELGVVAYTNQDFPTAEVYFRRAISVIEDSNVSVIPEKWSTLLQNLGHTCCKLGKYEDSLEFHQNALRVCPGMASSYASIGLVESYLGRYEAAIVALHKALSLQKDHTVAAALLSTLMSQVVLHSPVFQGDECVMAFDLISIDRSPTTGSSGPVTRQQQQNPTSNTLDNIKSILGSSIGKPAMHSSDIVSENLGSCDTPQRSSDSAMNIEDMIMDDSP